MPFNHPKPVNPTPTTMATFDLPLRNRKDLARAAQLRNFAIVSGRSFNPRSTLPPDYDDDDDNDPYLPISRRRPHRSLSTPYYNTTYPFTPFFTPEQTPETPFQDPYTHPHLPTSYPRRTSYTSNNPNPTRLPFATAARALHRALDGTLRQALRLQQDYDNEMRILPYADERTRAHLWTLKVEYRGWNADADAPPDIANQVDFFAKYAECLLDAMEDMRCAERPSGPSGQRDWEMVGSGLGRGGYEGGGGVTMEDLRLAMKKLGVSFGAVGELLEGVKGDRQRCGVLVRELKCAMEILKGVEEVWESPGKNGKGRFRGEGAAAADGRIPIPIPIPVPVAASETWDGY